MRGRQALERYLDSKKKADEEQLAAMGLSAVQSALQKLKRHSEREARFIPQVRTDAPIYNLQTALDTEHVLIFAHAVTVEVGANVLLQPRAEAAKKALSAESLQVMVDAGYVNGEHAARCDAAGILPGLPASALSKARVTARCLAMNISAISLRQTLISVLQTRLSGTSKFTAKTRPSMIAPMQMTEVAAR